MQSWRKDQTTSVTIPLWQGVAQILLSYLVVGPDILGNTLESYLGHKWLAWAVRVSLLLVVLLGPYALFQRRRRPSKKEQKKAIAQIKESALAKYDLHLSSLAKEFDTILKKYAVRGLEIPPGAMAGDVFDLYKNELGLFAGIIEETIKSYNSNNIKQIDGQPITAIRMELLQEKASYLNELYSGFIDTYFHSSPDGMAAINKENFCKTINRKYDLLLKSMG